MGSPDSPSFETCPLVNVCAAAAGDTAPLCGIVPEHMAPLVVAEKMCLRALYGAYQMSRKHRAEAEGGQTSLLDMRLAWSLTELARAHPDDGIAEEHFKGVGALTDSVFRDETAGIRVRADAATLWLYLPAFQRHRKDEVLTEGEEQTLYEGLGHAHDFVKQLPSGSTAPEKVDAQRGAVLRKLTVLMLGRRVGVDLLPASAREEIPGYPLFGSNNQTRDQRHTHDIYSLPADSDIKVPLKIAATKIRPHSDRVTDIVLNTLIGNTFQGLRGMPSKRGIYNALLKDAAAEGGLHEAVGRWLTDEAKGNKPRFFQNTFLDMLSARVAAKVKQHKAYLESLN